MSERKARGCGPDEEVSKNTGRCIKKCGPGQYRSEETNRCRKIQGSPKAKTSPGTLAANRRAAAAKGRATIAANRQARNEGLTSAERREKQRQKDSAERRRGLSPGTRARETARRRSEGALKGAQKRQLNRTSRRESGYKTPTPTPRSCMRKCTEKCNKLKPKAKAKTPSPRHRLSPRPSPFLSPKTPIRSPPSRSTPSGNLLYSVSLSPDRNSSSPTYEQLREAAMEEATQENLDYIRQKQSLSSRPPTPRLSPLQLKSGPRIYQIPTGYSNEGKTVYLNSSDNEYYLTPNFSGDSVGRLGDNNEFEIYDDEEGEEEEI